MRVRLSTRVRAAGPKSATGLSDPLLYNRSDRSHTRLAGYIVLGVDVCPVSDQDLHYRRSVVVNRPEQRRGPVLNRMTCKVGA